MTDLNPSYGSPFVQGARRTSPKEVMYRICEEHPDLCAGRVRAVVY
jgi:hypothetical protein